MLIRLGEYIDIVNTRNTEEYLNKDDVVGISTQKMFIETKADLTNVSTKNYKIVDSREFAYVSDTSRRGDKISLAFNNLNKKVLVSSISTVFKVINESILLPEYLYIYFNRPEFDRIARFNSWGSARETFSWEDLCDLKIEIPSIEIQQKYVDVFNTMTKNQANIESSLEDLKLTGEIFIEQLRGMYPSVKLRMHMERRKEKNTDLDSKYIGISKNGFIIPKQKLSGNNILNKKSFYLHDFIFSPSGINVYNNKYKKATCSHVNEIFFLTSEKILPKYLALWLDREEFLRYSEFHNISSVMSNYDEETLLNYAIPLPPIEIQKEIVNIYDSQLKRIKINEKLKNLIKDICPILIKGATQESKGVI